MPAILPEMKSGLPKPRPVHSAPPIPQKTPATPPRTSSSQRTRQQASHIPLKAPGQAPSRRGGGPQSKKSSGTADEYGENSQIYTDWANHYLSRSGQKRLIKDLQQDVADGVLLAELIQAVANEKIGDINGCPKSRTQMIQNIDTCLGFLEAKGVDIQGLCAEEIRSGNLKSILGLFFSLSRYKQQQQRGVRQTSRPEHPSPSPAQRPSTPTQPGPSSPGPPACTHTQNHAHSQDHESRSTASAQRPAADMLSSLPSKASSKTQSEGLKLSVAQRKTSRLPAPPARAPPPGRDRKPQGSSSSSSSSSSNRRSQSFHVYDKPVPCAHTASSSCDRERSGTASPVMTERAPSLAASSCSSSSSSSIPPPSAGSKPWRSKSLNVKHSATSPLLSVKQDPPPPPTPSPPPRHPAAPPSSLEAPPKVTAQKSMLEKFKLFNSRSVSRGSSSSSSVGAQTEDRSGRRPGLELHLEADGNSGAAPGATGGRVSAPASPLSSTAASPKLALKGIAQRTIGRALTTRKSSLKPAAEKDKARPAEKDKAGGGGRGVASRAKEEEEEEGEEGGGGVVARREGAGVEVETAKSNNAKISSFVHKKKESSGSGSGSTPPAHSGIPRPGGGGGGGEAAACRTPSGGRDADRRGRARAGGGGLSVHKPPLDSRSSSSCSSLASSEGRCHRHGNGAAAAPPVAGGGGATQSTGGNTASVKLPRPQQQYHHPNTATVAPFMYRSQPDVAGTGLAEAGSRGPAAFSQSAHSSLEDLTGEEDSEARRLRTVRNIADLRQNLEETMSCLRGTQISHSALETTFDGGVTTEVTGGGRGLSPRSASALPWRPSPSSPRLEAGDAPSAGSGYGAAAARGGARRQTPAGQEREGHALDLADKMEELEGVGVATAGYASDGDALGRSVRMDHVTSGYITDGGAGIYTRRRNRLPNAVDMTTPVRELALHRDTAKSHTDSWDDSSSCSSGISDTFDTDDIISSSVSSYVTTPSATCKDIQVSPVDALQLQTDAEKHEVRRSDGGSDSGVKMEPGAKWGRHPSDMSDESDRSSSGRRTPSIAHTGSWRRGMSAQVGVTSPRAKTSIITTANGSLKTHGTGKTDDAKVSERGCLSPPDAPARISSADAKKPPSSSSSSSSCSGHARTPTATSTFGFKKNGGLGGGIAMVTASGVTITSGSATLGKMPKSGVHLGGHGQGGRTLGRQTSVDDGYLSAGGRHSALQYRSLPRPGRASGGAANAARSALLHQGGAKVRGGGGAVAGAAANQTDREKGVSGVDGDSTTPQGTGPPPPPPRQAGGGKYPDVSSPTLRRLFGGGAKPGKQAPVTTTENMKHSTVISNPHAAGSAHSGGSAHPDSPRSASAGGSGGSSPLYYASGGGGGGGGGEGRAPPASSPGSALSTPSTSQSHSLAWSSATPSPGGGAAYPSLGSLATSSESMDVSLGSGGGGALSAATAGSHGATREEGPSGCVRANGVKHGYSDSPLSSPSASPKFSRNTLPRKQDRYGHLPALRGHEEPRDWLRSHSAGGLPESSASSPFSTASSLSSPSGSRFHFSQLAGSPTAAGHMTLGNLRSVNGLANHEGVYDPYSDPRLRNSSMSLEEKSRTMSSSGSFRDGLEEVHGSSLSLVSSTSSVYSTPEEKAHSEIRKLRRELDASQEKVSALTTQLSANAHLVAAFEQSLGNMTIRLQSLTSTAEQKDSELSELRKSIEYLKKQNSAAQAAVNGVIGHPEVTCPADARTPDASPQSPQAELRIRRQHSSDSVSSITSATSHSSLDLDKNKRKKKNWLRSSFKQAFGKKKSPKSGSSHSDMDEMMDSAPRPAYHPGSASSTPALRTSHSSSLISECVDGEAETVMQLRSELRDKEMKLTDIRLEALSSAHQLDQLRESMNRMQAEMERLKQENERLRTDSHGGCSRAPSIASPSINQSQHSLGLTESTSLDMLLEDSGDRGSRKEGRHVKVVVSLDQDVTWREECRPRQYLIGCIGVSGKTKWDVLDGVVRRLFKEYIMHVDPEARLGLDSDSVLGYSIGEVQRAGGAHAPELLPCGYLVGDSDTISVSLKGVSVHSEDSLAFETLIPRPIMQRYVSQLQEHRRVILQGPSGTGKSFLASRLAEHMVRREGLEVTDGAVATFNVDHKSSKELRQYLSSLVERCSGGSPAGDMPVVVILDSLHHLSSLGDVFNGLLHCKHHRCPYIIGTMNQTSSAAPNLQLHHNFRWVLCANHTEPVKGFLGRFLRRKLLETEISSRARNSELVSIMEWIPRVWQHLNHFLETHSSSDVTIGPRLFLSCPMDVEGSRVWFTDLWNYSVIPYMLEAVREGLQLYGRRAVWEDPAKWVTETYPWSSGPQQQAWPPLLQLRPQDVGFDGHALTRDGCPGKQNPEGDAHTDPLVNMLMRLKEAAHGSGPQSYDSDSNSNDRQDDAPLAPSLESTL